MKHKALIDAFETRASMRVARRILAQYGFPRGQGWEAIKDKLAQVGILSKADFQGLENGLSELLVAGDKGLRVFKLSPAEAALLRSKVASLKIDPTNVFVKHFPYPAPDVVMQSLPPQPMLPISKFSGAHCTGLLFSSVNFIDVRERLTAAQIGPNASKYDEVIGIKKVKLQTFDSLVISRRFDYAYVLTDAHLDTTQGTQQALHSNVHGAVNGIAGSNVLGRPINFLPLVDPIYNSNAGLVRRLHYTTTTESGRQEWMRGSGNCLRTELSHKAGMAALSGSFKGYAIEVEYPLDEVNGYTPRPLLSIPGLYRMTYEMNPQLIDATLWGCANIMELETTLAELMVHVSGTKSV
jgi:hypothetical protein